MFSHSEPSNTNSNGFSTFTKLSNRYLHQSRWLIAFPLSNTCPKNVFRIRMQAERKRAEEKKEKKLLLLFDLHYLSLKQQSTKQPTEPFINKKKHFSSSAVCVSSFVSLQQNNTVQSGCNCRCVLLWLLIESLSRFSFVRGGGKLHFRRSNKNVLSSSFWFFFAFLSLSVILFSTYHIRNDWS